MAILKKVPVNSIMLLKTTNESRAVTSVAKLHLESPNFPTLPTHLAEQEAVDGQAGQLGHLPSLAVAPPGLQRLNGDQKLLLLDGRGSALEQAGWQQHVCALKQLAELAELLEIWACAD